MNREEGSELSLSFDSSGLIAAMIVDSRTRDPLMLAYMNSEAFTKTLETGFVHFHSRSRDELWLKGATSGNKLKVCDILIDCDQDSLFILVDVLGAGNVCHTGRRSCFYRRVSSDSDKSELESI